MSQTDLQLRLSHGKGEGDDWTKIEDKARRKTIQNRLAQRKRRTKLSNGKPRRGSELPVRPADEQPPCPGNPPESATTSSTGSTSPPACEVSGALANPRNRSTSPRGLSTILVSMRQNDAQDVLAPQIRDFFAAPGLAEHRFMVLSQYNFLRAFVHNANILELDPILFVDDESISPWTTFNPYRAPSKSYSETLVPTPLQLSTFHHPYIDVLANPKFRDSILLAGLGDDQELEFCHALHEHGFTIWGSQPWNPMGWELSQAFVDQWGWLMDEESIRFSNFWRFERGELPLITCAIPGGILGEVA